MHRLEQSAKILESHPHSDVKDVFPAHLVTNGSSGCCAPGKRRESVIDDTSLGRIYVVKAQQIGARRFRAADDRVDRDRKARIAVSKEAKSSITSITAVGIAVGRGRASW